MAIVTCPECGRQVSTNAATCQNCGNRMGRRSSQQLKTGCMVLAIIGGIFFVLSLFSTLE